MKFIIKPIEWEKTEMYGREFQIEISFVIKGYAGYVGNKEVARSESKGALIEELKYIKLQMKGQEEIHL